MRRDPWGLSTSLFAICHYGLENRRRSRQSGKDWWGYSATVGSLPVCSSPPCNPGAGCPSWVSDLGVLGVYGSLSRSQHPFFCVSTVGVGGGSFQGIACCSPPLTSTIRLWAFVMLCVGGCCLIVLNSGGTVDGEGPKDYGLCMDVGKCLCFSIHCVVLLDALWGC